MVYYGKESLDGCSGNIFNEVDDYHSWNPEDYWGDVVEEMMVSEQGCLGVLFNGGGGGVMVWLAASYCSHERKDGESLLSWDQSDGGWIFDFAQDYDLSITFFFLKMT